MMARMVLRIQVPPRVMGCVVQELLPDRDDEGRSNTQNILNQRSGSY